MQGQAEARLRRCLQGQAEARLRPYRSPGHHMSDFACRQVRCERRGQLQPHVHTSPLSTSMSISTVMSISTFMSTCYPHPRCPHGTHVIHTSMEPSVFHTLDVPPVRFVHILHPRWSTSPMPTCHPQVYDIVVSTCHYATYLLPPIEDYLSTTNRRANVGTRCAFI